MSIESVRDLFEVIKDNTQDNEDLACDMVEVKEMLDDSENTKKMLDDYYRQYCNKEEICPECGHELTAEITYEDAGEYMGMPVQEEFRTLRCSNPECDSYEAE